MNAQKPPTRFRIGQVLFALFAKEYVIVPFRIAEENVIRNMQGEQITYKVVYGQAHKVVDFSTFSQNSTIYDNLTDAKTALLNAAKAGVERVVVDAANKMRAWFPDVQLPVSSPAQAPVQSLDLSALSDDPAEEPTEVPGDGPPVVQLPDGTIARIKIGGTNT